MAYGILVIFDTVVVEGGGMVVVIFKCLHNAGCYEIVDRTL